MRIISLLIVSSMLSMCGKKDKSPPPNDSKVGGEERLFNSISCVARIPSLTADGSHDPVRGFELKLIAFMYDQGSVAMTLESKYVFNADSDSFTEVRSRVYAQNEKSHELETDLLLVKAFIPTTEVKVFKKYKLGETFDMECK